MGLVYFAFLFKWLQHLVVFRYKGTYCSQEVAIKILKAERLNSELQKEFAQEVYIMRFVICDIGNFCVYWLDYCSLVFLLNFAWTFITLTVSGGKKLNWYFVFDREEYTVNWLHDTKYHYVVQGSPCCSICWINNLLEKMNLTLLSSQDFPLETKEGLVIQSSCLLILNACLTCRNEFLWCIPACLLRTLHKLFVNWLSNMQNLRLVIRTKLTYCCKGLTQSMLRMKRCEIQSLYCY